MDIEERCVRYMEKVECRVCGTQVYPDEDECIELINHWEVYDIEDLKEHLSHVCDACLGLMKDD